MNFVNDINQRFQKKLEAKPFPVEKLSDRWIGNAIHALRFASIIALGINPEDLKKLLDLARGKGLSLYHFAVLSNNLQACTAAKLNLTLEDYQMLMEEADQYVSIWNELTKECRTELDKELEEEAKAKDLLLKDQQNKKGSSPLRAEA